MSAIYYYYIIMSSIIYYMSDYVCIPIAGREYQCLANHSVANVTPVTVKN